MNGGAADGDSVSGKALKERVNWREGKKAHSEQRDQPEKTPPQPSYEEIKKQCRGTGAQYFADIALSNLERIMDDNPTTEEALREIIEWCHTKLKHQGSFPISFPSPSRCVPCCELPKHAQA